MKSKWHLHFAVPGVAGLLFVQTVFMGLAQTPSNMQTIEAFFGALQEHDTNAAWQLLENNTNLARPFGFGPKLPLLEAAADGDLRVANRLVELGADVNAAGDVFLSGNAQMTALEGAAGGGHSDICKLLLVKGADPNLCSFSGQSALHFAFGDSISNTNREEITKMLLESGANPFSEAGYYKTTPLELAITKGDGTLIPLMLEGGRAIKFPAKSATRSAMKKTAAKAMAQFLDAHGTAMLSAAAQRGELEAVQSLFKAGVSAKANVEENLPLMQAFALAEAAAARTRPSAIEQWQQTSNALRNFGVGANPTFLATLRSQEADQAARVETLAPERWLKIRDALIWHGANYDAFAATALGDINQAQRLLAADNNVIQARDRDGQTPLHWAVLTDQLPLTSFWIQSGVSLAATNSTGQTALHLAAAKGFIDQVKVLLAAQAPTDIRDTNGWTPLDAAIQANQSDSIRLLLENKTSSPHPERAVAVAIHRAAAGGNLDALAALVETATNLEVRNELGLTPLQLAVLHGHLAAAALLADKGADVDARDPDGNTLLHQILLQDQVVTIHYRPPTNWLARTGQDSDKMIYLKYLTAGPEEQGPNEVLQVAGFLLACGIDVTATNRAGQTALQLITDEKLGRGVFRFDDDRTELLQLLNHHGGSVDEIDANGDTALHRLAHGFYSIEASDTIAGLIAAGAEINAKNREGRTPLHETIQTNYIYMDWLEVLLKAHADVNGQDKSGLTPLHLVAMSEAHYSWGEAADALLQAGANPNLKDNRGAHADTPFAVSEVALERSTGVFSPACQGRSGSLRRG
jgi:ankyrin repeat protein